MCIYREIVASRVLQSSSFGAEQNYCATKCEFVVIIQGLHNWRHYLIGCDVMVKTDHASL